ETLDAQRDRLDAPLRIARSNPSLLSFVFLASFDSFDLRVTNDLRPPRRFRLDLSLELFRGADGDAEANRRQAFLHLGSHQNLGNLAIEMFDDLLRRSSR